MTGAARNQDGSPDSQVLAVTLLASLQHFLLFFLLSKMFLLLVHNTHPPNTHMRDGSRDDGRRPREDKEAQGDPEERPGGAGGEGAGAQGALEKKGRRGGREER